MSGKKLVVGYYSSWAMYARKFTPDKIDGKFVNRVVYAFFDVKPDGTVFSPDTWADQNNFPKLKTLRDNHPGLKVVLSIGGWTYSPHFEPGITQAAWRHQFVQTAVAALKNQYITFDGLDIDYEKQNVGYTADEAAGYASLLTELRAALPGGNILSVAVQCAPIQYNSLKTNVPKMNKALDYWNLMAYDFSGSWDPISNYADNIYKKSPLALYAGDDTVNFFHGAGVPLNKLVLGIPLYSRSFLNTDGIGKPFSGVPPGSWDSSGTIDYKYLPLQGSTTDHDGNAIQGWAYNPTNKQLDEFSCEYQGGSIGKLKGQYIKNKGLGGAMFWELSGDKGWSGAPAQDMAGRPLRPGNSLVKLVATAMN